jgi:hypothetical protein
MRTRLKTPKEMRSSSGIVMISRRTMNERRDPPEPTDRSAQFCRHRRAARRTEQPVASAHFLT